MTMAAGTPVVMFIKKGAAGAIGHTFGVRVQRVRPAFGRLVQRKGRMHLIVYELLAPVVPALQPPILKKRRPFKGAVLLPLFGYFCRNYFCFFFTGRFLHNLVNTDGEKGHQVEKDEGIGQGIVAFGNEVDNTDFGEGH